MNIKKNDTVVLIKDITGNPDSERGKRGRVLHVFPDKKKIVVEGIGFRYKHVRRSREYPSGGRVQKEREIDVANVMLVCPKCDRGVRVNCKREPVPGREKVRHVARVCRKCGTEIGAAV